ncbi:hypothetical protein ACP70R_012270 [Stipagrostis hirtigluma subsp. patula]
MSARMGLGRCRWTTGAIGAREKATRRAASRRPR